MKSDHLFIEHNIIEKINYQKIALRLDIVNIKPTAMSINLRRLNIVK